MNDEHLIPVDIACNDDYGTTTHAAHAVHLPGIELSAINISGVHFAELRGEGIRISRRKWPARHLQSCVGNIYWERYGMESWTAAAFLTYLRGLKSFSIDGGHGELYAWWETGIRAESYLRGLLIDAAKDD